MEREWIKKQYQNNRYIINLFIGAMVLLGILGITIILFWRSERQNTLVNSVQVEELQREDTLEGIPDAKKMAEYVFQAVQTNNLDMFLRGCPIDEMGLNADPEKIIEEKDKFSIESVVAPSSKYKEYFPITSSELTYHYASEFAVLQKEYEKIGNYELKEIQYVYPEKQLEDEYSLYKQNLCEQWGADNLCEVAVFFENGQEVSALGMTLVQYYGTWKLFSYTSNLLGTTEETIILTLDKGQYQELIDEQYEKKLQKEFNDDLEEKQIKKNKELDKETDELLKGGNALLPANYFVSNNAYGSTPEKLLQEFVQNLQKKDAMSVMNYLQKDIIKDGDKLSTDGIKKQKDAAEEVKKFYYEIMTENTLKEGSLQDIGKSPKEIVKELDPEDVFYIDLLDTSIKNKEEEIYIADIWYNGITYQVDFDLISTENGWQIETIGKLKEEQK